MATYNQTNKVTSLLLELLVAAKMIIYCLQAGICLTSVFTVEQRQQLYNQGEDCKQELCNAREQRLAKLCSIL